MNNEELGEKVKYMNEFEREAYLDMIASKGLEKVSRCEKSRRTRTNLIQHTSHMLGYASLYEELIKKDIKNGDYRRACRNAKNLLVHFGEGMNKNLKDVEEMKEGLDALYAMSGQLGNVVIDENKVVDNANIYEKSSKNIREELSKLLWRNNDSY